jgi:hypothetical protein
MGPITLLKNFCFVGDNAQSWATDWIAIPAEFQNWQLVMIVKSLISGSNLGYTLQTTWDTDSATNTSATGGAHRRRHDRDRDQHRHGAHDPVPHECGRDIAPRVLRLPHAEVHVGVLPSVRTAGVDRAHPPPR